MTDTSNITQYTPGPWNVTGFSHRDYEAAEIGTGNKTVAVIVTEDALEATEEETANAALIAAAPELLAALNLLENRLGHLYESGRIDYSKTEDAPIIAGELEEAQAAIAKANGAW